MSLIDLKLLFDLSPYACAYGHMMSNDIYYYRTSTAYYEVLGTDDMRALSLYYERILRSFLVTKNLAESKRLVKADLQKELGVEDLDKIVLPQVDRDSDVWARITEIQDDCRGYLQNVEDELRKEKRLKTWPEIRAERFAISWPNSQIVPALMQHLETGKVLIAKLAFTGLPLHAQLYSGGVKGRERFWVSFWRLDGNSEKPTFTSEAHFTMEIADAVSMFPELHAAEWRMA